MTGNNGERKDIFPFDLSLHLVRITQLENFVPDISCCCVHFDLYMYAESFLVQDVT